MLREFEAAPAQPGTDGAWLIRVDDQELQLRPPGHHHEPGCTADLHPRGGRDLSRRQPLARACGKCETIWDATAGWGQDSLLLARLGYQVTASERARPIAILLAEAALRSAEQLHGKLVIRIGDSRTLLRELTATEYPDAVYIDPMFPPKRKRSALPKKEIQYLQALVGPDEDSAELLQIAREVSRQRVIVKRPRYAEPLAKDPTVTYAGKLVRYDVYYAEQS